MTRLALIAVLLSCCAQFAHVHAQADNPWGFEEEETPVETWQQLVTDQALDLGLFTAFTALALTSFFRKSVTLKNVTLVAAVVYLGIYKSQLLSIVNVFGVMGGNLPIFKYNLGWYLFAVFSIVSTVLWGRLYCGRICAYGALTQLLDPIVPNRYRYDIPFRIERHAQQDQIRDPCRGRAVFPGHQRHVDLSLRRAVLAVRRPGLDRLVDCARRAAGRDGLRAEISTADSCARSARRWGCSRR